MRAPQETCIAEAVEEKWIKKACCGSLVFEQLN